MNLLLALFLGAVILLIGLFALYRRPEHEERSLQAVEIRLADFMELRALRFKNFPRLFSDSDCRILSDDPRLLAIAKRLRKERRRLALHWLASVRSDVLALWLLRRLLIAYGVSLGPASELAMTCRVLLVLTSIFALQCCVFVFGPFAFHRIASRARKNIETYSRSCQAALARLPKTQLDDFAAAWRYHRAPA
jgi:hypothetical protein